MLHFCIFFSKVQFKKKKKIKSKLPVRNWDVQDFLLIGLFLFGWGVEEEELRGEEDLQGEVGHEVGEKDVGVEEHQHVELLFLRHLIRTGYTAQL